MGYQGCSTSCPRCDEAAKCVAFRGKSVVTLIGPLRLERHYYHCPGCHQGFCPWDDVLGLTPAALSPAAEEVTALAGVQSSFAEASDKTLVKLAGLHLGESTVERTTEAAGQRVGQALAAGQTFGLKQDWAWHKDADGRTVAYVAADATGVGQQGPGGAQADGRMANVAVIYNPVPNDPAAWANPAARRRPEWQARYSASLDSLVAWGQALRRQGAQVGMDRAERWIALSDGGNGLEDFLRTHFPRVEAVILDFYHAAEHLGKLAKALCPGAEAAAQDLQETWCHQLKHEGGQALLTTLRALELRGKRPSVRATWAEEVGYFENQVHRMDYPTYRARGWQIGSGPVESACKRVVGQRLKGAGMRWGEDGADAVCHLRALFLSEKGQWDAFWSRN
jgi:hypothetical protein